MAGDWIKVEKATARKLEVLRIAASLGIHQDHAFGLCVRFWMWCDDNLHDGHAKGVTGACIDALLGQPGFSDVLVSAGWLRVREGSLEVPNFDRHLSQTAKKRAFAADRKQEYRDRSQECPKNVPQDVGQNVGQKRDQRREELEKELELRVRAASPPCSASAEREIDTGEQSPAEGDEQRPPRPQYAQAFERFWQVYPRKEGKQAAARAYSTAVRRIKDRGEPEPHEFVLERAKAYAASPKGQGDRQFIPMPATWLNRGSFDDDPSTWEARQPAAQPQRPLFAKPRSADGI